MAAQDTFDKFNGSLAPRDREKSRDLTKATMEELLAVRSEDARVRLVHQYIKQLHDLLRNEK